MVIVGHVSVRRLGHSLRNAGIAAPPLARSVSGSGVGEANLLSNPSGEAVLLSSLCGQRGKPALKLVMQTCYHLTSKTTARQTCSQAGDANLLPLFVARNVSSTHAPTGRQTCSQPVYRRQTCSQLYVKVCPLGLCRKLGFYLFVCCLIYLFYLYDATLFVCWVCSEKKK